MAILTVVLGIVFILLMLSLLATTVMELISAILALRGKNLIKALDNMLVGLDKDGKMDKTIMKKFTNNAFYRQLSYRYGSRTLNPPSYIGDESFKSILFDSLFGECQTKEDIQKVIDELSNEDLKSVLQQLMREAEGDVERFKLKIKGWYNAVMERATGWYKRTTQYILIIVGIVMAVVLNADTLSIYEQLESNPQLAERLAAAATAAARYDNVDDFKNSIVVVRDSVNQDTLVANVMNNPENQAQLEAFQQKKAELDSLLSYYNQNTSSLGMGWKNVDTHSRDWYYWLTKALGWLITALAISLGAPFWFDILKKIVNIRNSGSD